MTTEALDKQLRNVSRDVLRRHTDPSALSHLIDQAVEQRDIASSTVALACILEQGALSLSQYQAHECMSILTQALDQGASHSQLAALVQEAVDSTPDVKPGTEDIKSGNMADYPTLTQYKRWVDRYYNSARRGERNLEDYLDALLAPGIGFIPSALMNTVDFSVSQEFQGDQVDFFWNRYANSQELADSDEGGLTRQAAHRQLTLGVDLRLPTDPDSEEQWTEFQQDWTRILDSWDRVTDDN